MSKVFHSRGENMKLLFQKDKGYFVWKSGKMQAVYSRSKSKLESGMEDTAINQQRYHKIQHLVPEIRHMAYNPKKMKQMSFELFDVEPKRFPVKKKINTAYI